MVVRAREVEKRKRSCGCLHVIVMNCMITLGRYVHIVALHGHACPYFRRERVSRAEVIDHLFDDRWCLESREGRYRQLCTVIWKSIKDFVIAHRLGYPSKGFI